MKKSLLAIAALSTIAGAAQAQSSVTLFGALDAGAYFVNGATTSANNGTGLMSSTIVSSNWGLKGTEDLGGGTKANFYAESGINMRNGGLSQNVAEAGTTTLFDRGLYVGVEGKWGKLDLGNKINPLFASHGALLPVSGNSVGTNAAATLGFGNSTFTHNAVSYTLPTMAGFNAAVQYGSGQQASTVSGSTQSNIGGTIAGSVLAASADYTIAGFTGRLAGQKRWAGSSTGVAISANPGAGMTSSSATYLGSGQTTWLVGGSYKAGAFTLGAGFVANQITAPLTGAHGKNPTLNNNGYEVGAGYQATPAVLVGLSWVGTTAGSNLINAQARYAFSKRTQAYAQLGVAANGGGLGGANGAGTGNMFAIAGSNGSQIGTGASALAAPNYTQVAFGLGLIHTF
ncbi:porin [Flavobacterium sp.]|uniref:porin n=1 Tax=Flavobacterium sp. TaxID=239 RepID=UPI0037BEDC00